MMDVQRVRRAVLALVFVPSVFTLTGCCAMNDCTTFGLGEVLADALIESATRGRDEVDTDAEPNAAATVPDAVLVAALPDTAREGR